MRSTQLLAEEQLMKIKVIAWFCVALFAADVAAAPTGNEWLANIESKDPWTAGFARGYASGVATDDGFSPAAMEERINKLHPGKYGVQRFCKPAGVTNGQIWEVPHKYVKDHPEKRHEDADDLIRAAYILAWPCADNPPVPTGNFRLQDYIEAGKAASQEK